VAAITLIDLPGADRSSLLRLHIYALFATRAVDANKALLRSFTEIRQV